MLPVRQLPRAEFTFDDGVTLPIRGLSRAEAIRLRSLGDDVTAVEVLCIQVATGVTEEEARLWHNTAPNGEIERLVSAIAELSGLGDTSGKADAEDLHSAQSTESTTSLRKTLDELSQK